MSVFTDVEDFHRKYNQDINVPVTDQLADFRNYLIEEECGEVGAELLGFLYSDYGSNEYELDKKKLTKELADLIYVTIGTAVTFGLPLEEVFKRVHTANMTKDGGVREDGKILKGEGYVPPILDDLFNEKG